MSDICDIAVAAWRLEKWLDNLQIESKIAAKSSLRLMKGFLKENEIELIDLTGEPFDPGYSVDVISNESSGREDDGLIITEMIKPIIKQKGIVVRNGQVVLGDSIKKSIPIVQNQMTEEKEEDQIDSLDEQCNIAEKESTANASVFIKTIRNQRFSFESVLCVSFLLLSIGMNIFLLKGKFMSIFDKLD